MFGYKITQRQKSSRQKKKENRKRAKDTPIRTQKKRHVDQVEHKRNEEEVRTRL